MTTELANKQHVLKNGRPTLAVLVGSMTSTYQEGILRGAAHVAAEKNYNIIGFCGGVHNSPDPQTLAREKVFDLVDMNLISGVISPFSSHMRFLDAEASHQFIQQFSSVPVVNIGSRIQGHTNVITDYETGFVTLFDHLYHEHGYRRILLMRGPEHHASSTTRMEVYKKLLQQYDLPFDEDLVVYSNLKRTSSKAEMHTYFDNINKPFDVAIAINDNQALGVMDACLERGIRVPEEVSVIGSMNTLDGAFATPALTSIEEPLFELGRAAAIELIKQIEGETARQELLIPTSLVIRQSCGCESTSHAAPSKVTHQIDVESLKVIDDPIFKETKDYFSVIVEQYKGGVVRNEVASLLVLYQQAIYQKDYDCFLIELQKKLESALKSEDIMLWLALTAKLQLSTLSYLELEKKNLALVLFIAELISLKNEIEQAAIKYQRFETEYYLNYFRAIVNNLNSSFDLTTIKKYTVDILQLSELYISIFNDLNAEVMTATNMVSVCKSDFIELDHKEFTAKNLIPDGVDVYQERFSLMVFPLSFRNKPIGFMTLNLSSRKGAAFENLRAIISSALKNEILIQDVKKAEKRFSDIAHSTSNWLWETDENNNFTYCSDSCCDIIGYPENVLRGQKINECNKEGGDAYINNMLNHEDLTDTECWYQHQNGKFICLLVSATPIITEGVFNGYRGVFEDITEQKLQEEKIKNLAYSDILTGLPNRTLFQDTLTETISTSSLNQQKFALMFIDLDHFKNINDSMGHAAGDLLLIELAQRLLRSIRPQDMLARIGGDEFIIILPNIINEAVVIDIAQSIFSHLKAPIIIYDKPIYSTLSLGISMYPIDGLDTESLLQKGDNAMYQAKSQGRNCYVFYDKLLEKKNSLRNMHEDILRDALIRGGFVLHYQAQVSAETGHVVGFEALVRIKDKAHGLVPPNNFIPLAEELGLIGKIDEWVFKNVCAQHADWRSLGFDHVRLSINLSALQLRNDEVLETYIKIIEHYDVDPADIQLEITENALIENEDVALSILKGFKEYGVSIALDDFGTGYSSLNCINLYPIDTIKIDRSFVMDAIENPRNKAIIQGIVLMASTLNLKIIAEGVETEEQYEFIKNLGCHEIQGYYFHKPCPVIDAFALLKDRVDTPKDRRKKDLVG